MSVAHLVYFVFVAVFGLVAGIFLAAPLWVAPVYVILGLVGVVEELL